MSNEKRSRLALQKKERSYQSAVWSDQTTQSESFGVTAGVIGTLKSLNDLHIPDPLEFNEEGYMSVFE